MLTLSQAVVPSRVWNQALHQAPNLAPSVMPDNNEENIGEETRTEFARPAGDGESRTLFEQLLPAADAEPEMETLSYPSNPSRFMFTEPTSGSIYNVGADIYTEAHMYNCSTWYYGLAVFKDGSMYDIVSDSNYIDANNQIYYGIWDTSGYEPGIYELYGLIYTASGQQCLIMP